MPSVAPSKILSVSQLTLAIKGHLESSFRFVSVQGEVSNCKEHSSGHIYFSLKDSNAQIAAVLFKGQADKLHRLPKSGDQVVITGELAVYPPKGNYQIIVRELYLSGIGELLLRLHQLKEILKARGWLDPSRKKRLPRFPKTIGIVTSSTGAAIQDILNILKRRFPSASVLLNPVKVQGEGAKEEIAKAIEDFNRYALADVLIVGRGGGSIEDLWAFNEEIVAKAIFESKIPIISAVGHETDLSISDLVADLRAPTPSSAAEIVTAEGENLRMTLESFHQQMAKASLQGIVHFRNLLLGFLRHPLFSSPYALLGQKMQQIDEVKSSVDRTFSYFFEKKRFLLQGKQKEASSFNPLLRLSLFRKELKNFTEHLDISWQNLQKQRQKLVDAKFLLKRGFFSFEKLFSLKKQKIQSLSAHLKAIDPKNLLQKGYSILFSEKERCLILSTKEVKVGEKITALVSDGKIETKVEKIL